MNNIKILASGILVITLLVTSCESLLKTDSDQIVLAEDHKLNDPKEVVYTMFGIFSKLDELSTSYVLLGELRGELMQAGPGANQDIYDIYRFNIAPDNAFNRVQDYYDIINNCNYIINYLDTSLVSNAEKILLREYSAAKAFRAWTYMQLALNYGSAIYYEQPLTQISDTMHSFPEYGMDELANILIQDLQPLKDIPDVDAISLNSDISNDKLFFPVRLLLGELNLWLGNYEQAAQDLYDLIYQEDYFITNNYQSRWTVVNGVFVNYLNWFGDIFDLVDGEQEQITMLAGTTEFGKGSPLDSLTVYNILQPSDEALAYWNDQVYHYTATSINQGDLRMMASVFQDDDIMVMIGNNDLDDLEKGSIYKYVNMSTELTRGVHVYRTSHLYLRYAEALNRAGKPNSAMAVLKNGMKLNSFRYDSIIPASEKFLSLSDSTYFPFLDFTEAKFDVNIGTHARGCGQIEFSNDYKIPDLPNHEDSVEYVEDLILEELALETAFEGNRFHDLMRVALRRNDPSILADRVSAKYDEGMQNEIRSLLMDQSNWYLPLTRISE